MEMRNPNITPDMDEESFHFSKLYAFNISILTVDWIQYIFLCTSLKTFISTLSLKIGLYYLMRIHKTMLTNLAGSKESNITIQNMVSEQFLGTKIVFVP